MKQFIVKNWKALTGLAAVLLIGGITMSFQDSPFLSQKFPPADNYADTIPEKNKDDAMKMKDFDKLVDNLDKTVIEKVNESLKQIDFANIRQEVENSLKKVDMEKIMKDVELSLKTVDLEKIMADVKSSLKDVDWNRSNVEMKEALEEARKEIDKAKVEIRDVNRNEIKKELDNARREIEKSRVELKDLNVDQIMNEARSGIDQAKTELKQTRAMFNEMESDGLIHKKDGFTIEYKDKDLFINGQKQPETVTDKYRKYFSKEHFKITIDKD